jgi:hypothetical protein
LTYIFLVTLKKKKKKTTMYKKVYRTLQANENILHHYHVL